MKTDDGKFLTNSIFLGALAVKNSLKAYFQNMTLNKKLCMLIGKNRREKIRINIRGQKRVKRTQEEWRNICEL